MWQKILNSYFPCLQKYLIGEVEGVGEGLQVVVFMKQLLPANISVR